MSSFFSTAEQKKKGSSFFTNTYDTESVKRQIFNADQRIQDAGYSKTDTDKRNLFERATNLPQGQNWFFDALELLGRPGSAIKNVADKTFGDKSQNVGEAAWRGFSGQDRVTGVDLAERLGIENKVGKFVAGLGIDIATDPLTYVPGGVLASGIKGGAGIAAKPIKAGYNALESASPALKTFRENRVSPALESGKDALGYMFKSGYRDTDTLTGGKSTALRNLAQETDNSRSFMQEENMLNIGNIAKGAGGIEKGTEAGRIVEAPLRQFEDIKGYEFPDGVKRTTDKNDLTSALNQNKSAILDESKSIKNTNKQYTGAISEFNNALEATNKQIDSLYYKLERTAGKEIDSATRKNIRQARTEAKRLDSQIDNFGQVESSILRDIKKQVRNEHEMNFNVLKEIRRVAPDGIRAVGFDLPEKLQSFNRVTGKGIDEVADELGYGSVNNLLQEVKRLDGMPRKLPNAEIEAKALMELERSGAKKDLAETLESIKATRDTVRASLTEVANDLGGSARTQLKAFKTLADSPAYNSLKSQKDDLQAQRDALRSESKEVKQSGIDKIRGLQSANDDLGQSLENPVMIQKEIERPARELSSDPKIKQAAEKLIKSNSAIREWAEQNGVSIPDFEGYMTHVWAKEERDLRKRVTAVDRGSHNTGNPKKSILNERTIMGSAEDANEKIGRKFFEPNAFFASGIGQKRLIDYVHAVSFRRKVLSDTDFAIPFVKGMDVPRNAEVIDTNNYKFLKDSGDIMDGAGLKEEIGGQYLVTKAAKQLLDRYQHINTDEGTKSFLKAYDTIQNFWKRGALFSIGYHIRNQAGAMFNNYVGGMNELEIAKYTKEGFQEVAKSLGGKESAMFTEYRKQGLSASALSKVEFAKFGEEPEKAIEKTVKNLSKDMKGQVLQRANPVNAFETSRELGNFFDQANRFALYKWAKDVKKMSPEEAAAKVREVQFDYSKTTPFESKTVARVLPFYRWMRNNIPFQIKSFVNDPRKYEYLNKARTNAQDVVGLDDENIPDYMKESFSIPFSGEDGKGKMLGLNLPLGDLAKLSRPGKTLVDSISPLLKTPVELATNHNMFRGKKIQNFEGEEKQYSLFGQEAGIPIKTAYAIEQATGQIGRGLSGFFAKPENVNQDDKNRLPSLGISSISKDFDVKKYEYYEKLNELKQMQDLMLFIEQQTGAKPRTLNEIKKSTPSPF